ncbi:MAG: aldo/keto reductase [Chloroflexi bacterium]|nr:aldo/keto reductase [Chloroflexota bacterium]
MKYRPLGTTGLEISEIVFGGGAVGGILINADDETRRAAIRMAIEGGINWIDTAPVYGNGASEDALGWLLSEIPNEERPYISTKVRVDPSAGDFAGQVERGIQESLGRLRMDSVDLFQLHNVVSSDGQVISGSVTAEQMLGSDGIADALDRLKSQGLTRHIGFTSTGESGPLKEVLRSGRFDTAQIYYNLLNPSAGRSVPAKWTAYDYGNIIETAIESGVGVLNIRVLAAGVIATDIRHGREGQIGLNASLSQDEQRMQRIAPLLRDEHGSRSQVAVRYALANPGISGVLVGIAELEHLQLALDASEMGPLPDDLMSALNSEIESDFHLGDQ